MDNLYYSNFCPHSKKVIQYLVKNSLTNKLNFICLDKRKDDPKTQQIQAVLENGQIIGLPPNITSVPSLLLTKQNYRVIIGIDDIVEYFKPFSEKVVESATGTAGEPVGFSLSSLGEVVSENYTFYNMTPEELSAKGARQGEHLKYTQANMYESRGVSIPIPTPSNNYKSERMKGKEDFEAIRNERNNLQ